MTEYVTLDDALLVAQEFGFHVRDHGLLASALARPATTVFGADAYPSLDRKAAALLESVVKTQPFFDGNKRSGWTLMVSFLWINGYVHNFTTDVAFDLVVGVAEGRIDLDEAEHRIAAHRVPR
ncbi:type II toxin-antitoxin system death-on-curing family toxin [Microbacterium aurum]